MQRVIFSFFISILFIQTLLYANPIYHDSTKETVSIQLKWKHGFQFAGYYAAIEKGFYADEGLEVTLKERDANQNYIQSVLDGSSEYGVSDSSLIVSRLQKNPVVLVTQIFQYSPLVLIAHRDSNITTPYDMIGKKLMYAVNGTGDTPFKALIIKTIGSFDKVMTSEFTSYQDFIDRKVDVTSAYSTSQPYWLKKRGVEVNIIDPKSYGIDFYGDNLFTTQSEVKNHPQRVRKMKKATLKGWQYALSHQDEMIDIILKKYAPHKQRDSLEFEARGTYQMIMPDLIDLGDFRKEKYNQVAKTYQQLGIIDDILVNDDFFYHDSQGKELFTQQERLWIEKHPVVKVGGGPDWAPFDFVNSQGKYTGIADDYLDLLSQKTGLKFHVIVDKWANNLQKMKEQKIDMLHAVYYTKERDTYMHYTQSYFEMLDYFFVRDDLDVKTLKDLDGKRVAMPKGYAHEEILKKEFPKIKIVTVDTFSDAIDAVLANEADILFDTYAALSYKLKQETINTIIPFKAYRGKYIAKLHMATNKSLPLLATILDKGLSLITRKEKEHIYNRWLTKTKKGMNKTTKLSLNEQAWLAENPQITCTGDPNWLPFEAFDEEGTYKGIVADYLAKIETLLPLTFHPIKVTTWQDTLALAKEGKVDVISDVMGSESMQKNYTAITPYLTTPLVIVMRDSHGFVNDINDISNKKIALIKGYGYVGNIKKKYPKQTFVFVENADVALEQLSTGKIDAAVLSMPKAGYLIRSKGYNHLKIVGKTSVDMHLTLFVLKSKPILHNLLERTMQRISTTDKTNIINEWQKVEFAKKIDYTLLFQIAGLLGFFLLGTLYWNRKLSNEIDERIKIEENLKEREHQVHTLLDNIPLQILVTDYSGKVFLANSFTFKYYDLDKSALDDTNVLDFYIDAKERDEVLQELQQAGSVHDKIVKFKHPNDSIKDMMISVLPITYHKQPMLLSIAVDFTQRLEMENALSKAKELADEANKAKSEFLANMSHEIRTPMNSILGFSELLSKLITDPIQKDYLDSIQRGGHTLLNIINDILDLSKIEAGKLDIVLESVDIKQLALEMESIFSVKLIQKNLHFKLDIDPTLPKYLLLDNTRLRQVLFNLIGNAIKFTDHGNITLSIKKLLEDSERSKVDLQISLEDSGIGIAKENLTHIFDAFEQQSGQDQRYGGTGLGLAISKKLSEMMNGSISVKSELGKGSTFIIQLHDISISSIEAEEKEYKESLEHIQFDKATILVVDDIPDNRKLVASTLHNNGLEVIEAANGKEALENLQNIKIDLILMDIKMPIMDGYAATKIIKADLALQKIPLIALTASVMGKDLEKIKKYRFDGYLRKPISQEALLREMGKFLAHSYLKKSPDKEDVMSHDAHLQIPKVIQTLENDFIPQWKEIKEMGDFVLISDFSEALKKLGHDNGINFLTTYAQELHNNCESFDIDRVDFMLNSFPDLIEKLKGLNDV